MEQMTKQAIAQGYSIGLLEYTGLRSDNANNWLRYAGNSVASTFKGQSYQIGVFTDLSEVYEDKLYFAFKTKKQVQFAHAIEDSDGYIYNTAK